MKASMVARNGGFAMSVSSMSALVQSFSETSGIQIGFGLFKPIAKLVGAGLVLWLLVATYGLDLSPGFF
jgi:cellulose synthase/poly-beta-1,6-N-acetylglucosamine synthase-like glycosyltransferase